MAGSLQPIATFPPFTRVRGMERNTIIEDMPQASLRRAPPNRPPDKQLVTSPLSDDFPTPKAVPLPASTTDAPSSPATSDTLSSEDSSMWSKRSSRCEYDELYDVTDSESEEVQIRLSSSIKKRMRGHDKISKYPSLAIPSPSQWPTIEKLKSATPLSPPIKVDVPPAVLKKLAQRTLRVPSTASAPSLDGSTSGDDFPSGSSCPSTPDLESREDETRQWESPMQLDPSAFSVLQQLNPAAQTQQQEAVIEVPAEVVREMQQVEDRTSATVPVRLDTMSLRAPTKAEAEEEFSALSVPSPGGFFASLNTSSRHTWTTQETGPSTSMATEFYDLPFRNLRASTVPDTADVAVFYRLPGINRQNETIERTLLIASPTSLKSPVTAKKGVFSPSDLVKEVDELDENYDAALQKIKAASIDRTASWISSQDEYMKTVCETAEITDSFADVADATPKTPEQASPGGSDGISPGKKSVRFAEATVEPAKREIALEEKPQRISPIHDGTFWDGWRHTKRSQRARDVFQHRQARAEAEHVRRTSCQSQHLEQLKGNFETKATLRPAPSRPVSFFPDESDDETKDAVQQMERERQALDQMSTSSWQVSAQREINGGKLLTSPNVQSFRRRRDVRILDLHGQVHCSWAWNVAIDHPDAIVYTTVASDAEAHVLESRLEGPDNHVVVAAPKAWELPFEDNYFDVLSARNLYVHLRTVWPKGHAADEWDLTLRECLRVLKPGGYLEFDLLDAELIRPATQGRALGVEFAFNLKTRGYDPCSSRNFLPRLKRAGFTQIKRAWMVLPVADVVPKWIDAGKAHGKNGSVSCIRPSTDSSSIGSAASPATASTSVSATFSPNAIFGRHPDPVDRFVGPAKGGPMDTPSPSSMASANNANEASSISTTATPPTGSTKDVRAMTGIVGARMWEQWMLKLDCEMGRSEKRCLEGVAEALEEGGKTNAAWGCLVGWARKGV